MIRIPVYQPSIGELEKQYVNDCLDSNWISSKGKYVQQFEQAFAARIGVRYATSVCNGTAALHVALVSLGIGPGDEVIVPTLTYIASVNAIRYTGATPVFVDSRLDTWQIDTNDVRAKITPRTRAILAVHLYGHPCDMDELGTIAASHDLFLIEDCAEAIGTSYHGRHVGNFGHISAFSFFGNKTITTGEGGMVVTNDRTLYERAIHFKNQGLSARQYWQDAIGYNYRMTNICAAIGLAQMSRLEEFLSRKRQLAAQYKKNLTGLPLSVHGEYGEVVHSYWMISIIVRDADTRDPLRDFLTERGIETRPLFYPVHTMPMYDAHFHSYPNAEYLGWRGINLPSWPELELSAVDEICAAIREFYASR